MKSNVATATILSTSPKHKSLISLSWMVSVRGLGALLQKEENFPVLFTEEIFLYQIYSNLLSNAVKYNDKKDGRIKVGMRRTEEGEPFYFLEDNGPGIPESKRGKVFKMFALLHQKPGSSGIGLVIVRKIISERGGRIWVEDTSSWSSGIKFCITWPAETVN